MKADINYLISYLPSITTGAISLLMIYTLSGVEPSEKISSDQIAMYYLQALFLFLFALIIAKLTAIEIKLKGVRDRDTK